MTTSDPEPLRPGAPLPLPPEFPVAWAQPDDAGLFWTLDQAHWPDPMSPLAFAVAGDALARGLARAALAYDRPLGGVAVRRINTYRYQACVPAPTPPAALAAQGDRSRALLRAAMARLGTLWEVEWLPELEMHLDYWARFDLAGADTAALLGHLDETLIRAERLWEIHFLLASPMYAAISEFGRLYRDLFAGASVLDAYRLLEGFDDQTLAAAQALWELGRRAEAAPAVRAVLAGLPAGAVIPALDATPEGQAFLAELRAYLDTYGHRGDTVGLESPRWIEDPTSVIANLQDTLAQPHKDVRAARAALAAERDRLIAEARDALQGYPGPVVEEFEFLLQAAQTATVLSEDHGHWIEGRGLYHIRRVFLETGRRLAVAGALDAAADVFYLTPEEVRAAVAAAPDHRPLVALRRAEMARFGAVDPPPMLGTSPSEAHAHDPLGRAWSHFFHIAPHTPERPGILRGTAGSAGVARGPARVICALRDAGRLRPGDILVTPTTPPSWSPLFAIAGAVVTDTGGLLSHCAVIAREYGLPAVVGVGAATGLIADGQIVEVDGTSGEVRLLSPT